MASSVFVTSLLTLVVASHCVAGFSLQDADTQHLQPQNANLTQQIQNEQAESSRLQTQVTDLERQLTSLGDTVTSLGVSVSNFKPAPVHVGPTGDPIAFEATLGSDSDNMETGFVIPFKTVLFNVGNAYDPSLGIFECKKKGIYLFAMTLVAHGERAQAAVELTLSSGGRDLVVARPYTGTGDDLVSTGEVAIVEANAGDQVTLRYSGLAVALVDEHSRFSGVLIHELP